MRERERERGGGGGGKNNNHKGTKFSISCLYNNRSKGTIRL